MRILNRIGKVKKNSYITVLQQNWGRGWSDILYWPTNSQFKMSREDAADAKRHFATYKREEPKVLLRFINRKTRN